MPARTARATAARAQSARVGQSRSVMLPELSGTRDPGFASCGQLTLWTTAVSTRPPATLTGVPAESRFLTLADVADVLNISASQVYALVRNGDVEAIKIGGRGQWRVERSKLEDYISRMYDQTSTFIAEHPFVDADSDPDRP